MTATNKTSHYYFIINILKATTVQYVMGKFPASATRPKERDRPYPFLYVLRRQQSIFIASIQPVGNSSRGVAVSILLVNNYYFLIRKPNTGYRLLTMADKFLSPFVP